LPIPEVTLHSSATSRYPTRLGPTPDWLTPQRSFRPECGRYTRWTEAINLPDVLSSQDIAIAEMGEAADEFAK
jgi:hypothetical protein